MDATKAHPLRCEKCKRPTQKVSASVSMGTDANGVSLGHIKLPSARDVSAKPTDCD